MSASLLHMHAQELRDTWQVRCLTESRGKLAAIVTIVLAHAYTHAMKTLLRVAFPGFRDIQRPFFTSGATIVNTGKVVCDMVDRNGRAIRNVLIYENEGELVRDFRGLADKLKLTDAERIEMTESVKRWVVADLRVNHLGERVA